MVVESIPSAFRRMFADVLGRSGCRFAAAESFETAARLNSRIPSLSASLLAHVAKVATLWPLCKLQRSIFSSVAMRFKVKSFNTYVSGICMPISGTFKVESYYLTTAHTTCDNLHRKHTLFARHAQSVPQKCPPFPSRSPPLSLPICYGPPRSSEGISATLNRTSLMRDCLQRPHKRPSWPAPPRPCRSSKPAMCIVDV